MIREIKQLDSKRSLATYNMIANYYDWFHHLQTLWADTYHREEVAKTITAKNGALILDVCCGTALSTVELFKYNKNPRIFGIDQSYRMLLRGKRNIYKKVRSAKIILSQANSTNLPFAPDTFDWLVSVYGLSGISDLDGFMREATRVLKRGGGICIAEMCAPPSNAHAIFKSINNSIVSPIIKAIWEFQNIDPVALLKEYGFTIEEARYLRNRVFGSTMLVKGFWG